MKRYKDLKIGDVFYELDRRAPEKGIKKLLFISLTTLDTEKVEIRFMEEENGPIKILTINNYNENSHLSSNNISLYSSDIDIMTEKAELIIVERIKEIQDKIKEHEDEIKKHEEEIKNLDDKLNILDRLLLIKNTPDEKG